MGQNVNEVKLAEYFANFTFEFNKNCRKNRIATTVGGCNQGRRERERALGHNLGTGPFRKGRR